MGSNLHELEPGTVLVRFEDGSGIVVGDGSDEEAAEMKALLESQSATPEAVAGITSITLAHGLTLKAWVPEDDGRAFSGETFKAVADSASRQN